ncbi:MAG: hypothetical protein AAGA80_28185 [Cyanobacteria bacterium P01_F01_bin.143]
MLFRNNITFSESEMWLIKSLTTGKNINDIAEIISDVKDDLLELASELESKMTNNNNLDDLIITLVQIANVRSSKNDFVKESKMEEAAQLRDKEKKLIASIGGLDPTSFRADVNENNFEELREALLLMDKIISEESTLAFYVKPGTASPEEIGNLLAELSTLYRMIGGSGIEFRPDTIKSQDYAY